jgi:uncharacterized protein (DUF169 family)
MWSDMALKDWEKETFGKNRIVFSKRKDKTDLFVLQPRSLSTIGKPLDWMIYTRNNDKVEFFKTKSQALKFAKAYMKSDGKKLKDVV